MARKVVTLVAVLALAWLVSSDCQAQSTNSNASRAIGPAPGDLTAANGEHPLAPLIRWGKSGVAALQGLDDYSCKLVKRERIGGKLGEHEWLSIKVRHQPFSVYAAFMSRRERPRQEVVYVHDKNNGKMFVHSDNYRMMGTLSLFPDSRQAMREGRYPLTEVGILNLIERLVEHAENDIKFDDCEVKVFQNAKIESRPCVYLRVTHKERRPEFSFHLARIFIDNEFNVPVRYEAYTWPEEPNGQPLLMEEYTYLDFQFNQRFTDRDFDINNTDYYFPPDYDEPRVDFTGTSAISKPPLTGAVAPRPADSAAPIAGAIALARQSLDRLEQIRDYACLFSYRGVADGKESRYEHSLLKIRHAPFSAYAFFLGPKTPKGEEALFVANHNGGKALIHASSARGQQAISRSIAPSSDEFITNLGQPIDALGMKAQLAAWIAMWEAELAQRQAVVQFIPRVKVDRRTATCVEVKHPTAGQSLRYHIARIYIDDETTLPIRFEAYSWPIPGQTPPLVAEFNYRNVEANRNFSDDEFDPSNSNYSFGGEATARKPSN